VRLESVTYKFVAHPAETLDLRLTGTIGILLKAEKLGFIPSAYTKAKELKDKGFYISDEILNQMSGS